MSPDRGSFALLRRPERATGLYVITAGLLAITSLRCNSGDDSIGAVGTGGMTSSSTGNTDLNVGSGSGGAGYGSLPLDPLCGTGECIPDDSSACGMGGAGGALNDGGAAGGISYQPGDLAVQVPSCQVGPEADCTGSGCAIVRECRVGGAGQHGDPCIVQTDCSPGLACVGDGVSGVCRPYCCAGSDASCDDGSYCDERSLVDSPGTYVPVCLPVDDCSLSEPYPCTGSDCVCRSGTACVVVRRDGSTACTVPGAGRSGDACTGLETAECAYGFVCQPTVGCLKLCRISEGAADCPDSGNCLGLASVLGDGLGICALGGDSTSP